MLSQTADRIYWFARYLERTENTARLILVRHQLVLDLPGSMRPDWRILLDMQGVDESCIQLGSSPTEKKVMAFMFGDQTNPSSLLNSIVFARENLRTTREVMPSEVWERINSLYLSIVRRSNRDLPRSDRYQVLTNIIQACQQINGILLGTMNHDAGYQFIRLGRNIERADMSSRIVDVGSENLGDDDETRPFRNILWVSILRSLSAYQMFRQNMQSDVSRVAVLSFLLKGESFPRATSHCLRELREAMERLPRSETPIKKTDKLARRLARLSVDDLRDEALHDFIDTLQTDLGTLHELICETWLAPTELHKA